MRAVFRLTPRSLLAPLAIALSIACGLTLSQREIPAAPPQALEWLDAPRPVAAFSLAADHGVFSGRALRGHWQLLALGFTHCPDVCPATLSQLAALRAALPGHPLRIVFVSVDPARDSPARLADYLAYFGPGMVGATGADDELRRLAQSLGMDFRREGSADDPVVSHSPTIALIGPDGTLRGRLRPGFDTRAAARDIAARIAPAP